MLAGKLAMGSNNGLQNFHFKVVRHFTWQLRPTFRVRKCLPHWLAVLDHGFVDVLSKLRPAFTDESKQPIFCRHDRLRHYLANVFIAANFDLWEYMNDWEAGTLDHFIMLGAADESRFDRFHRRTL